jgi:hypothetical protein
MKPLLILAFSLAVLSSAAAAAEIPGCTRAMNEIVEINRQNRPGFMPEKPTTPPLICAIDNPDSPPEVMGMVLQYQRWGYIDCSHLYMVCAANMPDGWYPIEPKQVGEVK